MPYVAKDDIMAFIGTNISVTAGNATNVELILYKDYINNQLNAADADSITVSIYNSLGQKMYQYSNPVISGVTDYLTLGQPASNTQGHISFDITAAQSNNLANGTIYAQVTITYSNYYPSAKTYVLPQLAIGTISGSSISGGSGSGSGSGSLSGGSSSTASASNSAYIRYNVSAVDGVYPSLKSVTFNSPDPTLVTSIKFYNLDQNNVRNVLLENYLSKRDPGSLSLGATITIVDVDNPERYAIYEITGYSRINAEIGGGDDNDNDYTEVFVTYEDNSYSPVESPYTFTVGQTITYEIDAYGGSGSGSGTSGIDGLAGADGTSGIDGLAGADGTSGIDGLAGADGTSGIDGLAGVDGTSGIDGLAGADGTSGSSGIDGLAGVDGTSGSSGIDGLAGADGTSGSSGIDGTSGSSGIDGLAGADGTSGIDGLAGADGTSGIDGTSGVDGLAGAAGTSGTSGEDGIGIPSGGTSGQVLSKVDSNPYNTQWITPTAGSGSGSNKYLLRLNYDASEDLIPGTSSHPFITADGFLTDNATVTTVNVDTSNKIYSISVQFNESHPPTGIQVMAWQPSSYKYEIHPYRVDAADCKIDSVAGNFINAGSGQWTPNFFGSFTSTITLDVRQVFIKYGNSAGIGASTRNAHAYLMFIF